jgi:hypothetical protein
MAATTLKTTIGLLALAGACSNTATAEPYAELAHASNARTTDRNLGRNFLHLGWSTDVWRASAGVYIAGEEACFGSWTVGRTLLRGRWEATLTAHSGGSCELDGREVPFERNLGLCATRLFVARSAWDAGIGGCLWRQSDYTTGNFATALDDPLFVEQESPQPTAFLMIRWNVSHTIGRRDR